MNRAMTPQTVDAILGAFDARDRQMGRSPPPPPGAAGLAARRIRGVVVDIACAMETPDPIAQAVRLAAVQVALQVIADAIDPPSTQETTHG